MLKIKTILLIFSAALVLGSCAKIEGNFIENHDWELQEVNLNGGSKNMMSSFLPDFKPDSYYHIFFQEGGIIRGEYWNDGALHTVDTGEWEMVSGGHIYIKMAEYVDGVFTFKKVGKKLYEMTAEENNIEFYNVGMVEMKMLTKVL